MLVMVPRNDRAHAGHRTSKARPGRMVLRCAVGTVNSTANSGAPACDGVTTPFTWIFSVWCPSKRNPITPAAISTPSQQSRTSDRGRMSRMSPWAFCCRAARASARKRGNGAEVELALSACNRLIVRSRFRKIKKFQRKIEQHSSILKLASASVLIAKNIIMESYQAAMLLLPLQ